MKIKCKYCECAFDAMDEKCPHCGAVNAQAALYANKHEQNMRIKEQARQEAGQSVKQAQKTVKKIVIVVYSIIGVCICLPIILGIIFSISDRADEKQRSAEREIQRQEQMLEEQRLKEEQEQQQKAYDEEEISVSGLNVVAQKDLYYSIQVTDAVPYELSYDHNSKEWGENMVDDPHLLDDEHRVAINIKVTNYQDRLATYNNPTNIMKLYIEDENANTIAIQEKSFLNGSNDDNFYSGGKMISGTPFRDSYEKDLKKNQNMSWWVPVVVNENCKKIVLHFDYNMTITIDNPCAAK